MTFSGYINFVANEVKKCEMNLFVMLGVQNPIIKWAHFTE